jgi:hypothetical protein
MPVYSLLTPLRHHLERIVPVSQLRQPLFLRNKVFPIIVHDGDELLAPDLWTLVHCFQQASMEQVIYLQKRSLHC